MDGLLVGARAGRSGAVVVLGEPGVGKTALLRYATDAAPDFKVIRVLGMESEMELPFSALHQLCVPMLARLEELPVVQRNALEVTFGLRTDDAPDRFLVGLAVLSLVAEAAEERPLLCVVDDAQWLDRASAQVLGFVARRLLAEAVVMLFGARESGDELKGLPELVVEGLSEGDARDLLGVVIRSPLDERVRDQILAETRGNPLALLELPRGRSAVKLAGGFGFPGSVSVSGRIEENFRRRFEALPEDTRRLLVVAAAEPLGDPGLLWRAAGGLGIAGPALEPAEAAGLIEVGHRVRFRHPLARSAVYQSALPEVRREVHRALAEATDKEVDPDRRAWHLADAAVGPDEGVAAELERAAGRAQARGGLAAAAAFLDRATALTLTPSQRAERALAAAQAKHLAGAPEAALDLLGAAEAGPLDELARARVDLLRGQIAAVRYGSEAPPLLLQAAKRLEPFDIALARETFLEAISAAQFAGPLAAGGGLLEAAGAACAAPPPSGAPRPADLLLDGLARWFTKGCAAGAPLVKRALGAFQGDDIAREDALRWLAVASRVAGDTSWDHSAWEALVNRHIGLVRETGALTLLPLALAVRTIVHCFAGELDDAAALSEEQRMVTDATGTELAPYSCLAVAAFRGQEADTLKWIEATVQTAVPHGEGLAVTATQWAAALLSNGQGRYEDALAAADRVGRPPLAMGFNHWALVELVEAASRTGERETAVDALDSLMETTRPSGTNWARGVEARSKALLSHGREAEGLYREAIERLGRTGVRAELARAHLVYGEWLRRERRRTDAREQLRTARELLVKMEMQAFGARAERELLATGERVRRRSVETREDLTVQEAQIARLAVEGLSNAEIGARLFISPRTVEYHLHKVFTKLAITSRQQLPRALPSPAATAGLASG